MSADAGIRSGTELGGCRIETTIGEGGMGVVYEATQLSLDRKVALKVIAPRFARDSEFRERFRREGFRQAALDHPHIVPVYEFGESGDTLFLVMRLIRGESMKDAIRKGSLSPETTMRLLPQIADALDAAHALGFVHRDVKPQNILIEGNYAYLADFGLAKATSDGNLTKSGHHVGSLDYIAPEQIRGEPPTAQTDVYSFGITAYEALSGSVPFTRDTEAGLLYAHLQEPPAPLTSFEPAFPRSADDVLGRALAKDPAARYRSVSEFVRALSDALTATPAAVMSTPVPIRPRAKQRADTVTPAPPEPSEPPSGATPTRTVLDPLRVVPSTDPGADERRQQDPGKTAYEGGTRARPTVPKNPGKRRSRRLVLVALVVAALVAAVAAGAAVGYDRHSSAATAATPPTQPKPHLLRQEGSPVGLVLQGHWRSQTSVPAIPGLRLGAASAATDSQGRTVAVGTLPTVWPALVPTTFLETPQLDLRHSSVVQIGSLTAKRYTGSFGFDRVTVYAIPMTKDVATIECVEPSGVRANGCAAEAATVRLARKAVAIEPDATFARGLSGALAELGRSQKTALSAMRKAKTPAAEAAAARATAAAYASGATAVRALSAPAQVTLQTRRVASSLAALAVLYRGLAAAAGRHSPTSWTRETRELKSHEARVRSALAALRPYGYLAG